MDKYICDVCGYIYDPEVGDPDGGIEPGTAFADIPEDWVCPVCGVGKDDFSLYGSLSQGARSSHCRNETRALRERGARVVVGCIAVAIGVAAVASWPVASWARICKHRRRRARRPNLEREAIHGQVHLRVRRVERGSLLRKRFGRGRTRPRRRLPHPRA